MASSGDFNFSSNLQGPPAAVNAPNLFDIAKEVAGTNNTIANTGLTNAQTGVANTVAQGNSLTNQLTQLQLNQRQAQIQAFQAATTAKDVNTPAPTPVAVMNADGTPATNADGTPRMTQPPAPAASATSTGLTDPNFIDDYINQLSKTGLFTPSELLTQKKAYVDNQAGMQESAAKADKAISDAAEAKTKAATAATQHLGQTLLPVEQAYDKYKSDPTPENGLVAGALFTTAQQHIADLAVQGAMTDAKGHGQTLTPEQVAAVRQNAIAKWQGQVDPQTGQPLGLADPTVAASLHSIVDTTDAGQAYHKTQAELNQKAQETATSYSAQLKNEQDVVSAKLENDVKQGNVSLAGAKDLSAVNKQALQASGIARLSHEAMDVDDLATVVRNTYGSDLSKLKNVVVTDLSPRIRALVQTVLPGFITGQKDQTVDLTKVIEGANAKIGILDASTQAADQVKGGLGSDLRARLASAGAGDLNPVASNAEWSRTMAVRRQFENDAESQSLKVLNQSNAQAKEIIDGVRQGNPKSTLDANNYIVAPPVRGKNPLTQGLPQPAVTTPNGGKAKVVAGQLPPGWTVKENP